jgi:EAL domain-containing protein (putative c-di-GMP-specific phosphodiesterase class I)
MLRDADTAMYRAKAAGRSRHQIFDADMHERAMTLLRLETDLRRALERGELLAHYQPIIDMQNRTLLGFEALARWQHPERGLVSPDVFIPVAEETGLVGVIGEMMLKEACRQTKVWQDRYPRNPPLGISVNVSTRQLAHGGIADQVSRIVKETGLAPGSLTLELTETAIMQNLKAGASVIRKLHDMNVRVHIDDFGVGYSSMAYLQNLPVDTLKVDRSFVSRMNGQPQQTAIVRAIVALARNLGMDVIAEGVETNAQADTLLTLRCSTAQGFLFSRPLPSDEAERLIVDGLPPTMPTND